jgi:hypothetical protein
MSLQLRAQSTFSYAFVDRFSFDCASLFFVTAWPFFRPRRASSKRRGLTGGAATTLLPASLGDCGPSLFASSRFLGFLASFVRCPPPAVVGFT